MFDGYRVVVCSPTRSRKRHLDILSKYMLRDRHVIDKWELWMNVDAEDDKGAARKLVEKHPDFVQLVLSRQRMANWTQPFYQRCVEPDTIYVKLDDDIVFVGQDAIRTLLRCRLDYSHPFVVFGNTVNNVLCSHIHQRIGAVDYRHGVVGYRFDDKVGFENMDFVEYVHRRFLESAVDDRVSDFEFGLWPMNDYEKFSINFFAFLGAEWAAFNGYMENCDEPWITLEKNKELHRPNLICGKALCVHYAFGPQRKYLNENTDLLNEYFELAKQECK